MTAATRQARLSNAARQWGVVKRVMQNVAWFLEHVDVVPSDEARRIAESALAWSAQLRHAMARLDPNGESYLWNDPTPLEERLALALERDLERRLLNERAA